MTEEKVEKGIKKILPVDNKESVERYIEAVPDIFVERIKPYFDIHKEDDELTKKFPDDIGQSVRVLPLEKDGERFLKMVATDEGKTERLLKFLQEGNFHFQNEIIEGVKAEDIRERIKKWMERRKEEKK